nr:MAG TPA_asm: hypothetical protein [Caudoviricetes sp.]
MIQTKTLKEALKDPGVIEVCGRTDWKCYFRKKWIGDQTQCKIQDVKIRKGHMVQFRKCFW